MDLANVEKIMQLMRSYGMHEIEIKDGESTIKLTQSPPAQPALYGGMALAPNYMPSPASAGSAHHPTWGGAAEGSKQATPSSEGKLERRPNVVDVRSPFVGTYYSAPSPGADDFIHVGKRVRKGDTLCIVEAMKLMNEIEAERDGVIVEILVANEEPVEYDQVLFLME